MQSATNFISDEAEGSRCLHSVRVFADSMLMAGLTDSKSVLGQEFSGGIGPLSGERERESGCITSVNSTLIVAKRSAGTHSQRPASSECVHRLLEEKKTSRP